MSRPALMATTLTFLTIFGLTVAAKVATISPGAMLLIMAGSMLALFVILLRNIEIVD
jgi:hypothetical protein